MPNRLAKTAAVAPVLSDRRLVAVLDFLERALVAGFYSVLTCRLVEHYLATRNPSDLFALASETLVVALILIRCPAREISVKFSDWALALGATCAGMLLRPASGIAMTPEGVVLALQAVGLTGQIWCKASLFRNFGVAPALRGVATKGPYALLRHPMYASYFVAQLGYFLAFPTTRNAIVLGVWSVAQILRIQAEEVVLTRDAGYRVYAEQVRWRLVPGIY
jgi:protein-S-isoprenylcysteine O-methyltransferase Ste14